MAERTHSILIKDHRGGKGNRDFPLPGTGDVDFPSIFTSLKKVGFHGNIVIERVYVGYSDAPEIMDQRLRETRIYLERTLQEAGIAFDNSYKHSLRDTYCVR